MEALTLVDVIDLGLSGVLLFLLLRVMDRFDKLLERVLSYLEAAKEQRHKMATEMTALKLQVQKQNGHPLKPPPRDE